MINAYMLFTFIMAKTSYLLRKTPRKFRHEYSYWLASLVIGLLLSRYRIYYFWVIRLLYLPINQNIVRYNSNVYVVGFIKQFTCMLKKRAPYLWKKKKKNVIHIIIDIVITNSIIDIVCRSCSVV